MNKFLKILMASALAVSFSGVSAKALTPGLDSKDDALQITANFLMYATVCPNNLKEADGKEFEAFLAENGIVMSDLGENPHFKAIFMPIARSFANLSDTDKPLWCAAQGMTLGMIFIGRKLGQISKFGKSITPGSGN